MRNSRESLARELAQKFMENDLMLHEEISTKPYPYTIDNFMDLALEFVDRVLALKTEGD